MLRRRGLARPIEHFHQNKTSDAGGPRARRRHLLLVRDRSRFGHRDGKHGADETVVHVPV